MPVTTSNVSSAYAQELTRDEIIRRAFQLSSGLASGATPDANQIAMASDFLLTELDALQAEGIVLRTVESTNLTLVASTASYALPADTIDVMGRAQLVPASGSESIVTQMGREEYLDITEKTAEGTPTRFYVQRQATVTMYVWPVPDSNSPTTLRYQKVRLLKDMDTGSKTLDLERYWVKYVVWELAHQLAVANSIGLDRCVYLKNEATKAKESAKSYNRPHVPVMLRVAHGRRFY